MFSLTGLNFSYGDKKILHDISLNFNDGLIVGLLGPNGSGKSTLLKILGASLAVQSGDLRVLGQDALTSKKYLKPQLRYIFGVLFQGFSSDEKISARYNLLYAARLMGLTGKLAEQVVADALYEADLQAEQDIKLKNFSGGMRRRLELYRTFMHKPKIILLDEPTEGLDFKQSARFFAFLKSYQKKYGALVIFSTHRALELEHAHQVIMMNCGRVIAQDSPKNFMEKLDFMACTFELKDREAEQYLLKSGIELRSCDNSSFTADVPKKNLEEYLGPKLLDHCQAFSMNKPDLNHVFAQISTRPNHD